MNEAQEKFLHEVERFRTWASTVPKERSAEWESEYPEWGDAYKATFVFLESVVIEELDEKTKDELLFILAADNECEMISDELEKYPNKLIHLAQTAISSVHKDAKWQLATALGRLSVQTPQSESVLSMFATDDYEYTRRRALRALAEFNSPLVRGLIEPAWSSNDEYQRMGVLEALFMVQSPELERYLKLAEEDGREYLARYAAKIRSGETE